LAKILIGDPLLLLILYEAALNISYSEKNHRAIAKLFMARPLKVKINETVSELEKRLSKSITATERERAPDDLLAKNQSSIDSLRTGQATRSP
jgi:hypothetical protein